jgi:nucleotide-binding universal stress UspA family protein
MPRLTPSDRAVEESDRFAGRRLERILVPVDLSAGTAGTLRYARALASGLGGWLDLLHAVRLNIVGEEYGVARSRLIRELGEAARNRLAGWVALAGDDSVPTRILIREGRPDEAILEEARENPASLIVMATGRQGEHSRWHRPKTVARVIREAPCPVVVLPAGPAERWLPRRVGNDSCFVADSPAQER